MVVAAPAPDAGSGAVYVFERPASGGWKDATLKAKLTLSDGAGATAGPIAVDGDTIAVGGSNHKVGANIQQGAVYVFVKPPGGWKDAHESATLTASAGDANDLLGAGIAVSGDTIVAGAVGVGTNQGAAYVFVKPDTGWKDETEAAQLTASDSGAEDSLAGSIAIDGGTVVLGSVKHKVGGNLNQGAAYVYLKPAGGWKSSAETTELIAADGAAQDQFGRSVAVSGDVIAVGAPNHGSKHGAAYVFEEPSAGWGSKAQQSQSSRLTASDPTGNDNLGVSVAISGTTVAVGAIRHDGPVNASQGSAYVFTRPGEVWADATQDEEASSADGATGDVFGMTVALSGHVLFAGAPFHAVDGRSQQGAAYVFGVPPAISIASPVEGATLAQGESVAASYACDAPTCIGPVASGSPLDTSTLGEHRFNVDALDGEGVAASRSAGYTVVPRAGNDSPPPPPPPPPPPGKPVLSKLTVRPKKGTASFTLSRAAAVRLTLSRARAGRGKRFATVRSFTVGGRRGRNTVRIARRPLTRGRYRLSASPRDRS